MLPENMLDKPKKKKTMIRFMKIKTILSLVLCAALFPGCAKDDGGNGRGGYDGPEGTDIYGYVLDTDQNPVPGVVVSDGYTCVATDQAGMYAFSRNGAARFVSYSLPAEFEVAISNLTGLPLFHAPLREGVGRYDFTLKRLPQAETKFTLFCIGDPQVNDMDHVYRFKQETVADISAYASKSAEPVYAIALGDLVNNKWDLIPNMVFAMQQSKVGMPVFQTVGNHDHNYNMKDEASALRTYETYCGPTAYSFNRGDVHIVSMDNVLHKLEASDSYDGGLTAEQFAWLKQDLSFVPKEKMVIFCVHIPFRGGSASGGSNMNTDKYYHEVLELLSEYASAAIMSAHTHSNINYIHTVNGKEIYEHVTGTTCGAWWKSTVCTEGTPNGYGVYSVDGASIKKWIYKPVKYDENFQIRLYRGSDKFSGGDKTYSFSKSAKGQIVANIWNADPAWTVNVFEDGALSGKMAAYSDKDAWTVAYHVGVLGGSSSYNKTTDHLYYYTLKNPDAKVRIEAVDRFGRKFVQDEFTDPASDPGSYPAN